MLSEQLEKPNFPISKEMLSEHFFHSTWKYYQYAAKHNRQLLIFVLIYICEFNRLALIDNHIIRLMFSISTLKFTTKVWGIHPQLSKWNRFCSCSLFNGFQQIQLPLPSLPLPESKSIGCYRKHLVINKNFFIMIPQHNKRPIGFIAHQGNNS